MGKAVRAIDPNTGEAVIGWRDDDGRVRQVWPDPGALKAEDLAFQWRMGSFGDTIAGQFDDPEEARARAAEWAQNQPYRNAVRDEYPIATGIGEFVAEAPSLALPGGPANAPIRQMLYNVGTALGLEGLRYDPLKDAEDYGETAVNALTGDLAFRGGARILMGGKRMFDSFAARLGGRGTGQAGEQLTARGYRISRPSQMVDRDHPLRPTLERMEMASESSALPSSIMQENADFNKARLNNQVAKALGLEGNYNYFDESVLLDAKINLDRTYNDLASRLPEDIRIPNDVARTLRGTGELADLQRLNLEGFDDVRRWLKEMDGWDGMGEPPELPTVKASELFDLRSALTQEAAESGATVSKGIAQRIDQLDRVVAAQADEGWLEEFAKAREQWETLFSVQRPGVVGKEGSINPLALARSMASESNFGRQALWGAEDQFTNQATADLAGDVAALVKPEVYANSRTTDRVSLLNFVSSIADDPLYALATVGNTAAVNALLNNAQSGNMIGRAVTEAAAGTQAPLPQIFRNPRTGVNMAAQVGSRAATAPEGADPTSGVFDFAQDLLLPTEEVRDAALGPFKGTDDANSDRD